MRTTSIRTSLLLHTVTLIVLISATVLASSFLSSRRTVRNLSEQLIGQSAGEAERQLDTFFGSIEGMLSMSRDWWKSGRIEYDAPSDITDLNAVFTPLLDVNHQVTSMMLADETGFEYLLFRDLRGGEDYEWYNRIVLADEGPDAGFEMLFTHAGELFREGPLDESTRDYDPRKRPFYTEPAYNEIYWTTPYYFFITKDAGMTACYKWQDQASGRTRLVAFDLLLMDLSEFTANLQPSENGKAFVMFDDGSLIGIPRDNRWQTKVTIRETLRNPEERAGGVTQADSGAKLLTAEELALPQVATAIKTLRTTSRMEASLFPFISEGKRWWGGFRPYPLADQTLWIGVLVPEEDFLAEARQQRNTILIIGAIALIVGFIVAGLVARRFSLPLEQLAAQSSHVCNLDFEKTMEIDSQLAEVKQLADANTQMMNALDSFSRYVPMDLVRELLRRGEVAKIGGRSENMTVLFTDIVGFTTLSEQMDPEDLAEHMSKYFSAMLKVLSEENATVDKFIGDAIVAFWGAPIPNEDHARSGTRAVLHMVAELDRLNAEWREAGLPELRTRLGLHTGDAVVGNIGAPERLDYTVLGDTVNVASRLESLNRHYGTSALATHDVVNAAGDDIVWRHIDRVTVKGRGEPIDVFEPLGYAADISPDALRARDDFEKALHAYLDGNFADALDGLNDLVARGKSDEVIEQFRDKVEQYVNHPPTEWDGVTRYA